ncbi:MAG: tetratricopeptide repeat protein [Verrucomicrobiota bacterium]
MKTTQHKLLRPLLLLALIGAVGMLNAGCSAKFKENYHLRRADQYYAAGQYAQAEIEYLNALKNNRLDGRAWGQLGIISFDEGRFASATMALTRAHVLATNNVEVNSRLGLIYLAGNRWKDARDLALAILHQEPQNREAPILLAQASGTAEEMRATRARLEQLAPAGNAAAFHVARGILSLRENDFKTAAAELQQAKALDPKSSDAYWTLGDWYLAQKDLKQADQNYQTAVELEPARSGKKLQYAEFKVATGDPASGKRLLEEIVKDLPDYLPAQVGLANIAAGEQRYGDASEMLAKVLARDPGNFNALMLDVQVKMWQGQTAKAITELGQAARIFSQVPLVYYQLAVADEENHDLKNALIHVNQALKLDPGYVNASLLLGEIEIKQGDLAQAIAGMTRLIQQRPQVDQARLLLADAYRLHGDVAAAVQIYQDMNSVDPKNPQVHLLLGATLLEENQNAQARKEFETSVALAPAYLPAFEQLVNLDLAEKQYQAAWDRVERQAAQTNYPAGPLQLLLAKIAAIRGDTAQEQASLQKAIEVQPNFTASYLLLAQLYADRHQDQQALAEAQAGLAKDPRNVPLLMFLGTLYNDDTNYTAAAAAYETLLSVDPNYVLALNNLAYLYAGHLDRLDDAYQLALRARGEQSDSPAVADTLGWILLKKKQYASALPLLQESASKLPNEPEAQFHLGMVDYQMGNEAAARAAFERALQITNSFSGQRECAQCLAVLAVDPQTAGPEARAALEKRVAQHPDDLAALLRLAAVCQREGDAKTAEAEYEAAVQVDSENIVALLKLAQLYADSDAAKAFQFAKAAHGVAPNDANVTLILGRLAARTGDYKWAYSLLLPSVRNNTAQPDTLFDFGVAAYRQGKQADAVSAMRSAAQAGAGFAHAAEANRFLDLMALAENPQKAVSQAGYVENILKSEPESIPALMVEAEIAEQQANGAAAEQGYEKVLRLDPDFAAAQLRLAILYLADPGKDLQTRDLAAKARQVYPDDPALARCLGIATYRTAASPDDYTRAAELLSAGAQSRTQDGELFYYLGMAQYHLKQAAKSKGDLQRALALNLPDSMAVDAKRVLAELK